MTLQHLYRSFKIRIKFISFQNNKLHEYCRGALILWKIFVVFVCSLKIAFFVVSVIIFRFFLTFVSFFHNFCMQKCIQLDADTSINGENDKFLLFLNFFYHYRTSHSILLLSCVFTCPHLLIFNL